MPCDETRQSFAFLPRRSNSRIWISKPGQSRLKKFLCGRSVPTAVLPEGPSKNELRRTIMFRSHPIEPMVDKRRLSDTGSGNDCDDIYICIPPCIIQEGDIFLPIENIASRLRQSVYRNPFRTRFFCWRRSNYCVGIAGRCLLHVLKSNCLPFSDGACYRRYRFQKLDRGLKTPRGIFLEEDFNECNEWLWHTFELLER